MASGFYDTSILAAHNHTSTPGDGGALSNLSVLGTLTTAGTITDGGAMNVNGGVLTMTNHKITNLSLGTTTGDAIPFNQVNAFPSGLTIGGNTTSDANLGTISSVTNSNYYEGSFVATFSGPASDSLTFTYIRLGKYVYMSTGAFSDSSIANAVMTFGGGAIPSSLRPATQTMVPVWGVKDNGAARTVPGRLIVNTNGGMVLSIDMIGTAFTNGSTFGLLFTTGFVYEIGV